MCSPAAVSSEQGPRQTCKDSHFCHEFWQQLSVNIIRESLVILERINLRSHRAFVDLGDDLVPQLFVDTLHILDIFLDNTLRLESSDALIETLETGHKGWPIFLRSRPLQRPHERNSVIAKSREGR